MLVGSLAALGALSVLVATARYGIGLTPDSLVYLNGARSIADGDGFVHGGEAVTLFAPGYAAVLALTDLLGFDRFEVARTLSTIAFASTVVLSYALLRRRVRSWPLRLGATAFVACSAVLLEVYSKALSESLFVPVVLLFVLVCDEIVEHPLRLAPPVAAIVLCWCAFYLRYAGAVLWAVGALVVVAASWRSGRIGSALLRGALFGALAASVPAVWMLRNIDADGNALGPRYDAARPAFDNVVDVAKELSIWIATGLAPSPVRVVAFVASLAVVGLVTVLLVRGRLAMPAGTRAQLPIVLFVIVYVGYLVASAALVAFREIETRFLLPVFVPLVVLAAWSWERINDQLPRPVLRRGLRATGCAFLVVNIAWFADSALDLRREGAGGYARARWQLSHVMRDVRSLDFSVPTYTNDIHAVELFLDRSLPQAVARRKHAETGEQATSLPEFEREVSCAGVVQLIWFQPNQRPHLYTPTQLAQSMTVEPVIERSDGTVYEIRPGAGSPSCPDASG